MNQAPSLPRTDLYINGEWVKASSGKTIPVFNPATENQIAELAAASVEDVNRAVEAAHACFESTAWRRMRPLDRGRLLEKLALVVEEHADELARLETYDNGKPYATSRYVDLAFTIDALRYFGGWASKTAGEYITLSPFFDDGGIYRAYTERKPVGVVGGITPWNFPLGQAIQKIAPAIAFGCTVVLKPSEETSLTTLRLAELIHEVGFPKGAVNIVTGYGHDAGAALVDHPLVRKIAFTGSTATGQRILAASAKTMKRVTLELGGKSPTIILADADLSRAIPGAANAIFGNSGQVCTAGSRLLIEEPVYEEVVAGVAEIARGLRLGPGHEEGTQLGPIVSSRQLERISGLVQSGRSEGARVVAGGNRPDRDGWFFEPTVLADVRPDMQVIREEIFGPVVCAIPFSARSEIKAIANDTPYGLGASIWTRNLDHAHLLAEEIDAGTVWFNTHNILDLAVPFGGTKMSGLGREFGTEAINAFTEPKAVVMRLAGDY
ncbi:aldehyde dehydrogenase family protein [Devosia sp. 63-57]|uniref:aldehyde dehydrogenase family protein n=1 Tax=Devosia sp. 63-57 TaxID=1895751 RepID=UPI00086F3F10|nr:aldehyde dehydrogenase family protein [Devosia sp. 63-57]ODT47145.1 MAG: aldehyde dehydrogenase [Pelagibacterium sp. SCN 63-126]ODU88959.1 MAG: aldehyde dehydrogenase [Pelagibacterium sp. SCN 63-17]OJX43144.1 MAG: aldehyde dehydrogenase [Devosia sp. 63-57]